tara:strand:- start:118 stop:894 length:777 start_codon:yes stop_codon:yes gene_type:complete
VPIANATQTTQESRLRGTRSGFLDTPEHFVSDLSDIEISPKNNSLSEGSSYPKDADGARSKPREDVHLREIHNRGLLRERDAASRNNTGELQNNGDSLRSCEPVQGLASFRPGRPEEESWRPNVAARVEDWNRVLQSTTEGTHQQQLHISQAVKPRVRKPVVRFCGSIPKDEESSPSGSSSSSSTSANQAATHAPFIKQQVEATPGAHSDSSSGDSKASSHATEEETPNASVMANIASGAGKKKKEEEDDANIFDIEM